MRIGLIDVDGHNQKTRWGSAFPNLALMKISAWHKERGDEVEWYLPFAEYDEVYMSKVFKFTPDYPYAISNAKMVHKGGTGYDIHSELPKEIDMHQPDYSIYPWIDKRTAYGFLTRGCPNRCSWCVVPKKEGAIRPYMDIEDIAVDGRDRVVLMDNNILAAGDYAKEQISKIIRLGLRVDFNQALDARLVTDEFAQLLAQVKWLDYVRFGCDTRGQIKECDRAIDLLRNYGYKGNVFLYCMLTEFSESVERVMYYRNRLVNGEKTYPHVQPYRDWSDATYIPPKWQQDMARWSGVISIKKRIDVMDYEPRKGFKFSMYRDYPELRKARTKEELKQAIEKYGLRENDKGKV